MKCIPYLTYSLIFFISLLSYSYADVQEFSKYSTHMNILNNNTIEISKIITLKNTHTVGFIPGEVEFIVGNENLRLEIVSINSVDTYGNTIKHSIQNKNNSKGIMLNIQYPILPGFEYTFFLNYTLKFNPKGIFFKNINLPTSQSSIPIDNEILTITIPNNNYFTHISSKNNITKLSSKEIRIDLVSTQAESINFEYSKIPITIPKIKGSLLFWGLINIVLLFILIKFIQFEVKRIQEEEK